jgi:hypothetical protein
MELHQLSFDVLHVLIEMLPYEDIVSFSAVRQCFRELCLPHLFTAGIIMDTKSRSSTQFFESNDPPVEVFIWGR